MSLVQTHFSTGRFDGAVGIAPAHAGSLGGEQVRGKDIQSILMDAREELPMHMSRKIESKELAERGIKGMARPQRLKIEQVEKLNAYLEATRRFGSAEDIAAAARMLRGSTHPGLVAGRHGRAASQYALLQLALESALAEGKLDEAERLQDALADLQQGREDQIHADLNSAGAAAQFAPTAEGFEGFQQAYADIVLGKGTLADMLLVVLRRLAGEEGDRFGPAMKALLTALGDDLSSSRASTDSVRLQALILDMYHLEVAASVLENCAQLSRDLSTRFQLTGVVPAQLMAELVAMTNDRWLTPQRLRELATRFGVQLLLARIAFHTGTKNALRKMPVKVFPDGEVRRAMLDTAQQVLDEAVAEEEEKEGS